MNRKLKKMLKGKKLIGIGSTRLVFELSDRKVLKLAVSEKGIESNKTEVSMFIYASSEIREHLGCIIKYDSKYKWLVMEKYKINLRQTEFNERQVRRLVITFRKHGIIAKDIIYENGKINRKNVSLINKRHVVVIDYGKFKLLADDLIALPSRIFFSNTKRMFIPLNKN